MEQNAHPTPPESDKVKIYFLPNLLTAGNLYCSFVALTKIVEADLDNRFGQIKLALFYILLACIFGWAARRSWPHSNNL